MEAAPDTTEPLGPIVYMLCEFQLLDAESEALNESGDASHEAYKRRQKRAVISRLRISPRRAHLPDADCAAEDSNDSREATSGISATDALGDPTKGDSS